MNPHYFLAIDLGATSGRVILATLGEENLDLEVLHRFPTPLIEVGGDYYWNIYDLYEDILQGLTEAGKRKLPIHSIGIDTWGVDFALVHEDGTLAGLPRAYRDPYTNGAPEAFFEKCSREEVYRRTGIQIMNFNSLFQLFALNRDGSSALKHAEKLLFMPDALSYLLTGKQVCEYTILSTSQFMNPRTKQVDEELLAVAGVKKSLIPPVVMPGTEVGRLTPELARLTGLDTIPVVAVAGHDTGSAVAAVPAEDEGFAYLSSGTWSLMGVELQEPEITENSFALNYTNEGGVDGTTRFLKNITGMWLLEQCRAAWKKEGKEYSYPEIMQMMQTTSPSVDLIDPDAREFASPTDMPMAIRLYCESRGLTVPQTDAAMIRLIFDSLAAKYAEVLNNLRAVAPFEIKTLHVIGGGAQNALLNQMTADACGIPVVAGPTEATALGNVMVQARAAGLVGSLAEMRRYIRRTIETTTFEPKN